ncbi:MAG TPA: TetR family transcriptional regulator [Casimicrobiaceae bacterium]|nr:TetR family transcriptional regulator [Casimicrobiaceae bacterium]
MKPANGAARLPPLPPVANTTTDAPASGATKARILDAAESLFMAHGFEATSLRAITASATVNLAAVHYHFGSKEELFQSVLARRLDPMNRARLELLTRLESQAAPSPLPCERVLTAFLFPALALARDPARGGKDFLRLLGRAYADPAPFIRHFLSGQYGITIARFKAAFARALPHLPPRELSWRLHFIMGALSYTLAGTDALKLIAELNPHDTANDEVLLRRLAPFLLAGLTAPLPEATTPTRANGASTARRRGRATARRKAS